MRPLTSISGPLEKVVSCSKETPQMILSFNFPFFEQKSKHNLAKLDRFFYMRRPGRSLGYQINGYKFLLEFIQNMN